MNLRLFSIYENSPIIFFSLDLIWYIILTDYPNIFNFAFLELIPLDMNYFLNVVLPYTY